MNQAACSPADGTTGVACYNNAEQAGDPRSVVYARVARRPHKTVLEYWYFYYDDFYSYDYPPDDLFWQAHEGDWEVVSVVLDRGTQQPLYAAYSQHCTGERRAWDDVERSGSHPVDHVAIGSHANLFEAGSHPVATQCIPPAALQILAASGLPAPVDRSGAGRVVRPRVGRRGGCHRHPQGGLQAARLDPVRGDLGRGSGVPRSSSDRHAGVPHLADLASLPAGVEAATDDVLAVARRVR